MIPEGHTLQTWFNEIAGKLNASNQEIFTFHKYWSHFTAAQKTQIKNLVKQQIDEAISELGDIKNEINSL